MPSRQSLARAHPSIRHDLLIAHTCTSPAMPPDGPADPGSPTRPGPCSPASQPYAPVSTATPPSARKHTLLSSSTPWHPQRLRAPPCHLRTPPPRLRTWSYSDGSAKLFGLRGHPFQHAKPSTCSPYYARTAQRAADHSNTLHTLLHASCNQTLPTPAIASADATKPAICLTDAGKPDPIYHRCRAPRPPTYRPPSHACHSHRPNHAGPRHHHTHHDPANGTAARPAPNRHLPHARPEPRQTPPLMTCQRDHHGHRAIPVERGLPSHLPPRSTPLPRPAALALPTSRTPSPTSFTSSSVPAYSPPLRRAPFPCSVGASMPERSTWCRQDRHTTATIYIDPVAAFDALGRATG